MYARRRPSRQTSRSLRHRTLLLPCLLLSLVLAACGGGGSEEARIEKAIQASLLSDEPLRCSGPITARLRSELTAVRSERSSECGEDEAGGDGEEGDSSAIDEVEISGSTATVQIRESRGSNVVTLEAALVREDGEWKLDELVRLVGDSGASLRRLFKEALAERDELSTAKRQCIADLVEDLPGKELEDAILHFHIDALILRMATECSAPPPRGTDEEQIEETIETQVLSSDPATCGVVQNQRYLEENTGKSGLAALEACRAAKVATGSLADRVEIQNIKIKGSTATATVFPRRDGAELEPLILSLAKEGGRWKLDRLERLARIDRGEFVDSLLDGLAGQEGLEITATVSACIDRSVRKMPRDELEDLLRGSLTDPLTPEAVQAVRELVERCFGLDRRVNRSRARS